MPPLGRKDSVVGGNARESAVPRRADDRASRLRPRLWLPDRAGRRRRAAFLAELGLRDLCPQTSLRAFERQAVSHTLRRRSAVAAQCLIVQAMALLLACASHRRAGEPADIHQAASEGMTSSVTACLLYTSTSL